MGTVNVSFVSSLFDCFIYGLSYYCMQQHPIIVVCRPHTAVKGGRGGSLREVPSKKGNKGGWEEFGGDPGRLVAEYTARLLSALVSMSRARSYVLGEVREREEGGGGGVG